MKKRGGKGGNAPAGRQHCRELSKSKNDIMKKEKKETKDSGDEIRTRSRRQRKEKRGSNFVPKLWFKAGALRMQAMSG